MSELLDPKVPWWRDVDLLPISSPVNSLLFLKDHFDSDAVQFEMYNLTCSGRHIIYFPS
jgi:hypothetical protein